MPTPKQANWGRVFDPPALPENDPGIPRPAGIPEDIARADGGEDWWYDVCEIHQGGVLVGYAAAGYNTMPNWGFIDPTGCRTSRPGLDWKEDEFETATHRKGELRTWLAFYNLQGEMNWCRSFFAGTFYGVVQDSDGNIVAVGETSYTRMSESIDVGQPDVLYNPGWAATSVNMADVDCSIGPEPLGVMGLKAIAVKVDLSGALQWANCYGPIQDFGAAAWSEASRAYAVSRTVLPGNNPGLYMVSEAYGFMPGPSVFATRLNSDGTVYDAHMFVAGEPVIPPGASGVYVYNVDIKEHNGTEHVLITGAYPSNGAIHSFLWHFNDAMNAPYTVDPNFNLTTEHPAVANEHNASGVQISTSATLEDREGQLVAIWPVLSNYLYNNPYHPNAVADLKVHGLPINDPSARWTNDLGEVRAYDLRAGVVGTNDGGIAIVSSRYAPGFDATTPFCWNDVSPATQSCLQSTFNAIDWEGGSDPCSAPYFRYWNTDAYVAKLDKANGSLLWETQFDAEPTSPSGCFPDDMRKNECMYQIVNAEDGGLVICGNTSHNFDDAYLAKVKPSCQASLNYEPLPLNSQGQYILTSNETWASDRNIYGTIVIPSGVTLSITDNATIRFADSQQLYWPTRIEVEAGGTLNVMNATLAAVEGCPGSLWDGVLIKGDHDASQLTAGAQGQAFYTNSLIAQARIGTLIANTFTLGPIGTETSENHSGGIVQATNTTFRNNVYSVSFSPYENHTPYQPSAIRANLSSFKTCHFENTGDAVFPGPATMDHVLLNFVRGITFEGCDWKVDLTTTAYEDIAQLGTGLHSINSSFSVIDFCISDPGPYGCGSQTHSSFENLNRGIVATTFDPSRTFKVDGTRFTKNNMGIYMSGIQNQVITRCAFEVPEPQVPGLIFVPYGVYSDQCTGYTIQENSFNTNEQAGHPKVGLIINNSGKAPNLIYNNRFDNLLAAQLVQGKNRYVSATPSPYEGQGLEIRCNDFGQTAPNLYDVALTGTRPTIARQQGRNAIQSGGAPPDPTKPAGNVFSDNCTDNPLGDYFVQDEDSEWITYWYHESSVFHTTPLCYNFIEPVSTPVVYLNKEQACPTHLVADGPSHIIAAQEGKEGWDDTKDAYDAAKDNGDSEGLVAYLEDPANSSTAKRNALLSVAPKAGLEALKAAFNSEPMLSDWHLAQSLVANSPLDGEALKWTHESGLDPFFTNLVDGAQTGEVNLLTVLQAEMAQYSQKKAEALYGLGQEAWLKATETGEALDSLLVWTARYAPEHAKLTEAGVLSAKGEFSALEIMAANEELSSDEPEKFSVLKLWAQAEQTNGWNQPDQGTVNYLQNLGQQQDVIGSAHASAWMHALGEELAPEVIILPSTAKRAGPPTAAVKSRTEIAPMEFLEAYPNPTSGTQWVVYNLPEGGEKAMIRVSDALGREIMLKPVGNKTGILEMNTSAWSSGVYNASLSLDDVVVGKMKLMVQR
ncbi:MAG: T9SS type A sorting domain-containing protein [Flavobacteriales bacterium]|nr:T9SS type A sorting domain-containing protein [Flavobacteriales bacterium]